MDQAWRDGIDMTTRRIAAKTSLELQSDDRQADSTAIAQRFVPLLRQPIRNVKTWPMTDLEILDR
ncbi:MAG: hypothetical protein DWI24_08675 [Planctomycetota bacterium]|nr:MAG: hypothetical protein DWI24_08675 [Planctomycetota bacterium]